MADVLMAPDDDLFWPPTERTEAEAPEVATTPAAWIYGYLGSRVVSFSPGPDRVVVFCRPSLSVDAWAQTREMRALMPATQWATLAANWEPRVAMLWTVVVEPLVEGLEQRLVVEDPRADIAEDPPSDVAAEDFWASDLEGAVAEIKSTLGLTDAQLESASGISRSTIWRMRTRRTTETRPVTEAPIWRLHALTKALEQRFGSEGVRGWLHSGDPSPVNMLEAGQIGELEAIADRVLFPDAPRRSASAVAEDDYDPVSSPAVAAASPRAPRRVRPVRKRNDD